MKVIFSNNLPFFLAHGGTQTLLEALMRELAALGIEVEPERWWDDKQTGDVLHFMNRPQILNVQCAKQKGFKLLMTENLDQTASRSGARLFAQRLATGMARHALPSSMLTRLGWDVYKLLDAMVYVVRHEAEVATYLFGADPQRMYIISHGMEETALAKLAEPQAQEDYLVCAATIHPRKNQVLLAEAARASKVPVVFMGKPYSQEDSYFLSFKSLIDGKLLRYAGFVSTEEKYRLLRGARGFALLSEFESGSIAVYEASAAGLPLLLSDLPWAAKVYGRARNTRFVALKRAGFVAPVLREFHQTARRTAGTTFPLLTWRDVARKYADIYQRILAK